YVLPVFASVEAALAAWQAGSAAPGAGAAEAARQAPSASGPIVVRFWGTRGSLPAPLGHVALRRKIRAALVAANGRRFDPAQALDAFIDRELPFSVSGTFGGNSSCVEIATGGPEYVLSDLGTPVPHFAPPVPP